MRVWRNVWAPFPAVRSYLFCGRRGWRKGAGQVQWHKESDYMLCSQRADFIVENDIVVELKAIINLKMSI